MFKLLITGNGFDIARGLPTKYEHFLTFMGNVKADKWYEDLNYKEEYKRIMNCEEVHTVTYDDICKKIEEIEKELKLEPLLHAYSVFLKYYETFSKGKTMYGHSDELLNGKEIIRKLEKNEFINGKKSEIKLPM